MAESFIGIHKMENGQRMNEMQFCCIEEMNRTGHCISHAIIIKIRNDGK